MSKNNNKIKVAVLGADGRMGQSVINAISEHSQDFELVAKIDKNDSVENLKTKYGVQVAIDFTVFQASKELVPNLIEQDISVVIGTSGWTNEAKKQLEQQVEKHPTVGVLIAPNFAIGAILAKKFSIQAAKFFNSVEIIEMHHNKKADAPSGTAVDTAIEISKAMESAPEPDPTKHSLQGARGADVNGIRVHSVRLPGLLAHQETHFGSIGEHLTIKHDSFTRESFSKGVLFAAKNILNHTGAVVVGLENYM